MSVLSGEINLEGIGGASNSEVAKSGDEKPDMVEMVSPEVKQPMTESDDETEPAKEPEADQDEEKVKVREMKAEGEVAPENREDLLGINLELVKGVFEEVGEKPRYGYPGPFRSTIRSDILKGNGR